MLYYDAISVCSELKPVQNLHVSMFVSMFVFMSFTLYTSQSEYNFEYWRVKLGVRGQA